MKGRGCQMCHNDRSWRAIDFDHGSARFPLKGKHHTVACEKCHKRNPADATQTMELRVESRECAACHADEHQGQFSTAAGVVACEKCHSAAGWKPATFDHNTLPRFPLIGKHADVTCAACHKKAVIVKGRNSTAKYKRLDVGCSSCHRRP
jgi:hypothetical protein